MEERQGKGRALMKRKKMIAPIVITVLVLFYLAVYVFLLITAAKLHPVMTFLLFPVLALGGGMIYVLRERIAEIKGGEEDDLDNY